MMIYVHTIDQERHRCQILNGVRQSCCVGNGLATRHNSTFLGQYFSKFTPLFIRCHECLIINYGFDLYSCFHVVISQSASTSRTKCKQKASVNQGLAIQDNSNNETAKWPHVYQMDAPKICTHHQPPKAISSFVIFVPFHLCHVFSTSSFCSSNFFILFFFFGSLDFKASQQI